MLGGKVAQLWSEKLRAIPSLRRDRMLIYGSTAGWSLRSLVWRATHSPPPYYSCTQGTRPAANSAMILPVISA